MEELDAVAERFGRVMGGTALRVLVLVAGAGVGRALPKVPEGGLRALLSPPRYATVEGLVIESTTTAHVVADGTLVIAATAMGTTASVLGSACSDGKQGQEGYSWHHLATDKNDISSARGGPWTPLFARLFAKADMHLNDPANLVYLAGHKGPHPERYHTEVFRRLEAALEDCRTVVQCKALLKEELRRLADDVCTPGSTLHRLATTP
jgi:hypothetical protein